ncbi:4620_t:CDS:1, partial [Dentiscutata erythropus]
PADTIVPRCQGRVKNEDNPVYNPIQNFSGQNQMLPNNPTQNFTGQN